MCPDKNFKPEKYIHYPTKEELAESQLGSCAPFKLGLLRLSTIAQFGNKEELKSGLNIPVYQMEIDQLKEESKIARINFKR